MRHTAGTDIVTQECGDAGGNLEQHGGMSGDRDSAVYPGAASFDRTIPDVTVHIIRECHARGHVKVGCSCTTTSERKASFDCNGEYWYRGVGVCRGNGHTGRGPSGARPVGAGDDYISPNDTV